MPRGEASSRPWFAVYEKPLNRLPVIEDCIVNLLDTSAERERDQVGKRRRLDAPQELLAIQCARGVDGYGSQEIFGRQPWFGMPEFPHLGEEAQRIIAGEAVGPQADWDAELRQTAELKGSMVEIAVAP